MLSSKLRKVLRLGNEEAHDWALLDYLYADPGLFRAVVEELYQQTRKLSINKVCVPAGLAVGIAAPLASKLNIGLVVIYSDLLGEMEHEYFTEEGLISSDDQLLYFDDFFSSQAIGQAEWLNQQGKELTASYFLGQVEDIGQLELLKHSGSVRIICPLEI